MKELFYAMTVVFFILAISFFVRSIGGGGFRVGDCVRELGYDTVEKITVITPGGSVETIYPDKYNPGKYRRDTYPDTKSFVLAQCTKELR